MAGEAVRLDTHEHIFTVFDVPPNERDMRLLVESAFKYDHAEIAMKCRQSCFTDFLNEVFGAKAVTNQLRNSDYLQLVVIGEVNQVRNTRHRSVFLHNLADDAGRRHSCDRCQVHRCFGLPRPNQYTAVARTQREDMPGTAKIAGLSLRVNSRVDCLRAVECGDSRGYITPGFDRNAERRAIR